MCLAIPGKVLKIDGQVAAVDFGGARREIKLDLLKNVHDGDYVLVHAGFAIGKVSRPEAEDTLEALDELKKASYEKD